MPFPPTAQRLLGFVAGLIAGTMIIRSQIPNFTLPTSDPPRPTPLCLVRNCPLA
jgi:hypothetical protein